jgi:hypothetical protein
MLAALAALLLVGSSLGQAAHLAVVEHAICAEHGDLLHAADSHAATAGPADHDDEGGSTPEQGGDHEHCQLLARNQGEQALPVASADGALLPFAVPALVELAPSVARARPAQAPLSLAPKTSPPRRAAFG